MSRAFDRVGVVGMGTMGAGIAEVFARAGLDVIGLEPSEEALERGRRHLEVSTGRALRRGRFDADGQRAIQQRVSFTTSADALAGCDLVVEAVPEVMELKQRVFETLDDACRPDAVLATNTSSLSVTRIAVGTAHPERVVGLHFFNPAPVQRLVEVVSTVVTEPGLVADMERLAMRIGKTPVTVGDRAGFVANALLFGHLNRAVRLHEAGHVGREDLDAAMRIGAGLPMGPLALLDLVGLDTAQEILETMYDESRDPRHAPAPMLRQLVVAGRLGRKTGRGFYAYEAPGSPVVVPDEDVGLAGSAALKSVASGSAAPGPAAPGAMAYDGSAPQTRSVRTVAVVGDDAAADGLAGALHGAGYESVRVGAARVAGAGAAGAADLRTALAGCDLVIEATRGQPAAAGGQGETTRSLLAALGDACPPGTVIAVTAAEGPTAGLAAATGRAQDVVGINVVGETGAPRLVELVRTVVTAPEALAAVRVVAERLGAHVVVCADRAGRVVDGLIYPYLNDAVRMLESGYASVDDIDAAMRLGCGYPQGPFETLDAIGLDVALAAQTAIFAETREPGLAPAPLLAQLVTTGHLGRQAGPGFRPHSG